MLLSFFYDIIGRFLGEDKPPEVGDPLDFESGPLLDCGISWVHTFKKLVLPREYRTYKGKGYKCPSQCTYKSKQCKT